MFELRPVFEMSDYSAERICIQRTAAIGHDTGKLSHVRPRNKLHTLRPQIQTSDPPTSPGIKPGPLGLYTLHVRCVPTRPSKRRATVCRLSWSCSSEWVYYVQAVVVDDWSDVYRA